MELSTIGTFSALLFCMISLSFLATSTSQGVLTKCITPGQLAITFDDGPHPTITPQLLDLLKHYNLSTTFFVLGVGSWETDPTRYRNAILRAYNEGHQIGSHTYTHSSLIENRTDDQIRSDLRQLSTLIYETIGKNLTVLRPPFGAYNDQVLRIAHDEFKYAVVNWNIDTNDWDHPNDADAGIAEYVKAIESGRDTSYIGLHHDWTDSAVELANRTIQYVQANNFTIVNVAECIGVPMYQ